MTPTLAIEHLSKSYNVVRAVDDLSLSVAPGCIFGLLGRNGAGKTTTISCALGLVRQDRGAVWFEGQPLTPDALQRIAYVPESPALDRWMTGKQHLEYHRRIYKRFDTMRARELAEMLNVPLNRRVSKLSNGQAASLTLVLAFAQRADLICLDEPASGLDPYAQKCLLELIVQAGADGTTVLFSSHQIGHVERAAEEVAIIERGRLILQGSIDDLCAAHKIVEATFVQPPDLVTLRSNPAVADITVSGMLLRVHARGDGEGIARALLQLGATSIRTIDQSLEDIFLSTASPTIGEPA